jgi:hypothetical protein
MNTRISIKWQAVLLAAVIALASCSPLRAEPATPTIDSQMITSTVAAVQTEAVQSAYDQLTQTAAAAPTDTPTPQATDTPLPTETPVPTQAPVILPTATFAPPATQRPTSSPTQSAYQCSITSLKPAAGASINEGTDFDLNVTFKNIGTETWDDNAIDFKYLSGAKFQDSADAVDLSEAVSPDDSISLVVDMVAKTGTGTQSATWGLVRSGASFCNVTISINVK